MAVEHPFHDFKVQLELLTHGTREQLIAWLAWNDRNGIWSDEDSRTNDMSV